MLELTLDSVVRYGIETLVESNRLHVEPIHRQNRPIVPNDFLLSPKMLFVSSPIRRHVKNSIRLSVSRLLYILIKWFDVANSNDFLLDYQQHRASLCFYLRPFPEFHNSHFIT